MDGREQLILKATDFAMQAASLLADAREYPAIPYLKQAVAMLNGEGDSASGRDSQVAMHLLRMALVLLDRDGEGEAAGDVESALERLGEPFPILSDIEASAKIDWWLSRRRARDAKGGADWTGSPADA